MELNSKNPHSNTQPSQPSQPSSISEHAPAQFIPHPTPNTKPATPTSTPQNNRRGSFLNLTTETNAANFIAAAGGANRGAGRKMGAQRGGSAASTSHKFTVSKNVNVNLLTQNKFRTQNNNKAPSPASKFFNNTNHRHYTDDDQSLVTISDRRQEIYIEQERLNDIKQHQMQGRGVLRAS